MSSIAADGLALEYESLGNPADPAIVLVMGLGAQLILWPDALCAMLVARGFRVVRFDNRDAGLSTKLDHLGTPNIAIAAMKFAMHWPLRGVYAIDDMARDTLALMDGLGIGRAHVVGASMGGMIAQNLAAAAPHRVASLTSIMSTTGDRRLPPPTYKARRALLAAPARRGDIAGATARMMRLLRAIGSRTHPAPEAELRALCERHVRRSYHPPGVARQLLAIAADGDRTAVVKRIAAATLVLHGNEDPLLRPACGRATAAAIEAGGGRASIAIVEGMGHDLPVPLLPALADRIAAHCEAHP